jgi:hypothetical protein
VSGAFGPKVTEECRQWAAAFVLERAIVESAFTGYVSMLDAAGAASDEEIARGLSKLRRDIHRIIADGGDAPAHADLLDDMSQRLERSLERTALLEEAGFGEGIVGLRARLAAARSLVAAVRAALARRGRRSGGSGSSGPGTPRDM